ncbi:MAG: hypothetical protein J6S44_05280, partial [Clostridia bacterium]|nr:hypothetical protein [Clostridia bacterium]
MKHSVFFNDAENHWDNALPLGNGVMGAMLYFEGGALHMPLNHYEVYYTINDSVLPSDREKEDLEILKNAHRIGASDCTYGKKQTEMRAKADGNIPRGDEPFCEYRITREMATDEKRYSIMPFSGSYPATGEISLGFSPRLDGARHSLVLSVEEAVVSLTLEKEDDRVTAETRVLREDCVITELAATSGELIRSLSVSFAPCRDQDAPVVAFRMADERTLVYTVTRPLPPSGKPFAFSGVVRLLGARASLSCNEYEATLSFTECEERLTVLTGVFTDWRYSDTAVEGLFRLADWEGRLDAMKAEHALYWRGFFEKAS